MASGLTVFAYKWMIDMMRHHHEGNNRRPLYYDHTIASFVLAYGWHLYFRPLQFVNAFLAALCTCKSLL